MAVGWALLRRIVSIAGVAAMLVALAPHATADPVAGDSVLAAPTLSLKAVGTDDTISFYGESSSTTLSIPVPAGLTPVELDATVNLPFSMRYGLLSVTQDDRLISKTGLPLTDSTPIAIPLDDALVVNNSMTVTLTLTGLADDGFCLDQLHPVQLVNGSIRYAGTEAVPTTVADFLPPILNKLTIAVPAAPSQSESDAAVQLAASLVARYRSQAPSVALVTLADGATTLPNPPGPMERQIIIKEGANDGVSLIGTNNVPALLISAPPDKLTDRTRLLTNSALKMALSTTVVASQLAPSAPLPGNSATLAQLNQHTLTTTGVSPTINIALDQTQFGHPTQGFRVHLTGSYTPVPADLGSRLTASVGGEIIGIWPTDSSGLIDHWVDIPDRLVLRYTNLAVQVETSGDTGRCNEFRPISLTINDSSVVEGTPARPPLQQGFSALPQALMPKMKIGIGANSFADTVRATQIVVGLQQMSPTPLSTSVTSLKDAIDSKDPAILVSPDGWTDTSITLPVSANDRSLTVTSPGSGDQNTTLTLQPGIRFGSLQTVFDGNRSLVIATSNGASDQLDRLLGWLDGDPQRWRGVTGDAIIAAAGQDPLVVSGRSPASIYGPPAAEDAQASTTARSHTATWVAIGVIAAVAVGAGLIWRRNRRSRPVDHSSPRHSDE